jgi:hypothetical protein
MAILAGKSSGFVSCSTLSGRFARTVPSVIIITVIIITFMQGIYIYMPETNHVTAVHSVAAVLCLQFLLHLMLLSQVKYV